MSAPASDMEKVAAVPRCYKCDKAILSAETIVGINVSAQAGMVIMSPHCWSCALSALGDRQWNEAIEAAEKALARRGFDLAAGIVATLRRPAQGEG